MEAAGQPAAALLPVFSTSDMTSSTAEAGACAARSSMWIILLPCKQRSRRGCWEEAPAGCC